MPNGDDKKIPSFEEVMGGGGNSPQKNQPAKKIPSFEEVMKKKIASGTYSYGLNTVTPESKKTSPSPSNLPSPSVKKEPNQFDNIPSFLGKDSAIKGKLLSKGNFTPEQLAENNIKKRQEDKVKLSNSINQYNLLTGENNNADDILSSAEKTSQFLEKVKQLKTKRGVDLEENKKAAILSNTEYPNTELYNKRLGNIYAEQFDKNSFINQANDYISILNNEVVNKTIQEDKKNGVPKDKTITKIAQRTSPRNYKNSVETHIPDVPNTLNPIKSLGQLWDAASGNKDKNDLLNSVKGEAELRYNAGVEQIATDKISDGIATKNKDLIEQGKLELNGVDENVIYKYPSLVKKKIIDDVNNVINVRGKNSGVDYYDIMKELGYLDDAKTKDIAQQLAHQPQLFSDAPYLVGAASSFAEPFRNLFYGVGDITGFRNQKDIVASKFEDELFPTGTGKPDKIRSVVNTTSNLLGMMTIASVTEGLGEAGGVSKAAAERLGAYTSFGLPSYDQNLKESYNFLDNNAARQTYATIGAILNAEGGKILDLAKITRVPELSKIFQDYAKGISEKTLTEDAGKELLEKGKNAYVDFGIKYAANVNKGALTMAYFDATNNILKATFGDPETKGTDIISKAANSYLNGLLGMSIMGAFGAVADMSKEKNTTYKGFIYNMALNHDAAADIFKIGLDKGDFTQQEYNEKMSILNTAKAAKSTLDAAQVEQNTLLNENQKSVYVANKTAEQFLRSRAEKTDNEELKKKYESQADRLNQQNKDIFQGLKFSSTLEPLYELHDAEKKYNDELKKFNSGESKSDESLIQAKDNYEKLQYKYLERGDLPSNVSNEKNTTEKVEENRKLDLADIDKKIDELDKNSPLYDIQLDELEKQKKQVNDYYDNYGKSETSKLAEQNKEPELTFPARNDDFAEKYFNDEEKAKYAELEKSEDNEGIAKMISDKKEEILSQSKSTKNAIKEGQQPESNLSEHKDGDESGKTAEAGSSNSTVKSGEEQQKVTSTKGVGEEKTPSPSILNQETDLKGNDKEPFMQESKPLKAGQVKVEVTNDAPVYDSKGKLIVNSHHQEIQKAIDSGKYQQAIQDGKMTANDAKKIIESAGLEVPKEINDLAEKETNVKDQTKETPSEPTGKAVEVSNTEHPNEAANAFQGSYDRLIKSGTDPNDPEMVALKNKIDQLSSSKPKEVISKIEEQPPVEPPTPTEPELADDDSAHPTEVSLQRKYLLQQVQDAFYKPTDGSKSTSDDTVLNNAVNTLTNQALENKTTIDEQLKNNFNEWYSQAFNEDGTRRTDANGRNIQKPLTDEQQAQLGIYSLKLAQKIKDLKINSGSAVDINQLENLENEQLRLQNLVGVVGESLGSGLRYLQQIYKFTNDGNFEVFRKTAASMMGADVPSEQSEYDKFREGLSKNQQKAADIIHDALVKAKKITDEVQDRIVNSTEFKNKLFDEEVQKQIKSEVEKGIKEAVKAVAPKGKITDSKGRIIKEKANDIANKLNDIADKLGGKGLALSSPLGVVQIAAKWVLKGIAEGIRQGGKIPELIERGLKDYKNQDDLKDASEEEVLKMVQDGLRSVGIDNDVIHADTNQKSILRDIVNMAKNQNTNTITKEMVAQGYIKNLAVDLAERGISTDKIMDEMSTLLKENGIETDRNDLNEAYLKRGKYQFETLSDIQKGIKSVSKEITEHEKLQYDINELDKKIKEVNDTGDLSLKERDDKIKKLNQQKEDKYREFEKALREKGIKLERGSKESRAAKTEVINSYNYGVKEIGKRISEMLNNNEFGNIRESNKNFLRSIEKKLSHVINASDLNGQMDVIKGKLSTVINDLFKDHSRKDKAEDVSARANKGLMEVNKMVRDLSRDFSSNRQKTAEDIKLSEYKKRLESRKNDFERRKSAGEFDDTKLSVDLKKDAEALDIEAQMNKAKYDFYKEAKRAAEASSSGFVKFLRGTRELTRNLLLSGVTYIQAKLGLSALTRNIQIPSRLISTGASKLLGVESVRNRFDANAYWRGVLETVRTKSTKQIKDILQKSGNELEDASNKLNEANNKYKEILTKNNGDENSKEAVAYKTKELADAQAKYDVASLNHAVNNIYNHINPRDKGGRWIILKQGVTKEEAEMGMLGKKENFRDYLHEPYDDSLDNEGRIKEMNKRIRTLPEKAKRAVQAAVFASKSFVRFHGLWKDLPARQAEVEGYIKRLKAEQENPDGMDISDQRVQNKLWRDAVAWDGQEAKFQDKNTVVEAIRNAQKAGSNLIGGNNKNVKEAAEIAISGITPVLKVPFNIYYTGLQYKYGLLMGAIKTFDIMAKARGEDLSFKDYMKYKMTDEQRYKYFTVLGRGTVGAALMATSAIMMKNGNLIMGGQYPDPKKTIKLANGETVELQYGDIVMNGILVPHWLSLAINHLPNMSSFIEGYYGQEDYERTKGSNKGGDVLDTLYATAQREITEIPDLPLERSTNKYGETELSWENPYSYLGYFGAVKDIERAFGAGQDKAKEYELTPAQKIYDNMGLLFLVPSEKEAKEQKQKTEHDNLDDSRRIKDEFPYLFKKGFHGMGGGSVGGGGSKSSY